MKLVCATEEWLGKYQDLAFQRKLSFRPWPSRLSLLVAEGRELIAGVMVYDSTGPFLFFEHLITNETAPMRTRWAAVSIMAEEMVSMCRHLGKVPQVTVRHKGIKRILERAGLQWPGAIVMTCGFDQLEKNDYTRLPYFAPQHPRCCEDSTPTDRPPAGNPADGAGVHSPVFGGADGADSRCCEDSTPTDRPPVGDPTNGAGVHPPVFGGADGAEDYSRI